MSFSEMYCKATQQEPEQGELTGTCSMCGKHTNTRCFRLVRNV